LAEEGRQLEDVGIGHDAGQHPVAGYRHLYRALAQGFGHVAVTKQLAAVKQLGGDAATGACFYLLEIVGDRHGAGVGSRGVQRRAEFELGLRSGRPGGKRSSDDHYRGCEPVAHVPFPHPACP
jgi:hypothetical protein